ncbi:hypothetical protein JCGZ_12684 [Jatropha curcas]|uniref:Uncharacterized protein n=1 Tax=Jatropha curcas TaxID=180498 RepID=A0A067KHC0_JATCU|nr:hypothetical protein JCGZ_12684 [Jatropha curcas]
MAQNSLDPSSPLFFSILLFFFAHARSSAAAPPAPRFLATARQKQVAIEVPSCRWSHSSHPSCRTGCWGATPSYLPLDSSLLPFLAIHTISGGPSGGDRRQWTLHDAPAGWPPVVCADGSRFDRDDRVASCWYGKEKREWKNNERTGHVRIRPVCQLWGIGSLVIGRKEDPMNPTGSKYQN